jgi:hypothetical protein
MLLAGIHSCASGSPIGSFGDDSFFELTVTLKVTVNYAMSIGESVGLVGIVILILWMQQFWKYTSKNGG